MLVAAGVTGVQFANASTTGKPAASAAAKGQAAKGQAAKAQAAKQAAAAKAKALLAGAQNLELSCNVVATDAVAAKEIKLAKHENARELQKQNRRLAQKLARELAKADPRVPAGNKKAAKAEALVTAARFNLVVACLNLAEIKVATGRSIAAAPATTAPPTTAPTTTAPTTTAPTTTAPAATATAGATSSAAPGSSATAAARHF